MKKLLIIVITLLCIVLPNFANDDSLIYNPKTQQWEYNLNEIKFEYDNTGKLLKIGDMKVTYLENGQMDYIGDLKVKYFKNGRLKSVGKDWFNWSEGRLISIGKMHVQYNRYRTRFYSIGDYYIIYEYGYPYGHRIKQLVKYN